jgi:hypothetical protein
MQYREHLITKVTLYQLILTSTLLLALLLTLHFLSYVYLFMKISQI